MDRVQNLVEAKKQGFFGLVDLASSQKILGRMPFDATHYNAWKKHVEACLAEILEGISFRYFPIHADGSGFLTVCGAYYAPNSPEEILESWNYRGAGGRVKRLEFVGGSRIVFRDAKEEEFREFFGVVKDAEN